MITIEEKLKVFTKLVLVKAQQEFEKKHMETSQQNHEIIEKHKALVNHRGVKLIEELTQKGQAQKNKTISKAKLESKRKIMYIKKQLLDRLMKNIRRRAVEFTEQQAYEDFFVECVSKAFPFLQGQDGVQFEMTAKDAKKFLTVIYKEGQSHGFSKEQIDILDCQEDMVGGIVAVNRQRTLRIDCSIITILQEHEQFIGQRLYDALGKAGDIHE